MYHSTFQNSVYIVKYPKMKSLPQYLSVLLVLQQFVENTEAFTQQIGPSNRRTVSLLGASNLDDDASSPNRRLALNHLTTWGGGILLASSSLSTLLIPTPAVAEESIFAPKFIQEYPDFTGSTEGWSYKDVRGGNGDSPKAGDRVVFEWSGYTVGYFARPFEARGGPKGGAFDKDQEYARAVLGSGEIVKGLDCAFRSMQPGGIRQVLVPYGELGYPIDGRDSNHDKVGPKPSTFSGMRALNFVLDNPRVDRTMLFNVKLIRVDRPDGKGGFIRGDRA